MRGASHRRRSLRLKPLPPAAWVALLLLALLALRLFRAPAGPPPVPANGTTVRVERVVDGDTLLLAGGDRVRLIGVDTPETVRPDHPVEPLGPEASDFTRRLVEGREVRLEFDRERRDDFQRLLAYVYSGDVFLNEELIRAGYSRAVTRFPYSEAMKRRFRTAEAEARAAMRGLWALEGAAR